MRLTEYLEYLNANPKDFGYRDNAVLIKGRPLTSIEITEKVKKARREYRKK